MTANSREAAEVMAHSLGVAAAVEGVVHPHCSRRYPFRARNRYPHHIRYQKRVGTSYHLHSGGPVVTADFREAAGDFGVRLAYQDRVLGALLTRHRNRSSQCLERNIQESHTRYRWQTCNCHYKRNWVELLEERAEAAPSADLNRR